ncbi:MAG TPA: T9SS type A sorting domain-containing protein, partial [Candidatus Kapabacteria bacterium]|nr:T9SS type A sorting domain-containing protein [Candidatus Kapabacteria bacterium]
GADYRVIDRDVVAGGEYVYRLVTTSLDGERVVERQQTVKLTSATTGGLRLSVAPNPVRATATITLSGVTSSSTVDLFDDAGRLVRSLGVVTTSGTIALDATDLASGSYTVRVRTAGTSSVVERITVAR